MITLARDVRVGVLNLALRALTLASKFVLILALVRLLSPADVGLYALFAATILFGVQLIGLEFHVFNARELIARPREAWPPLIVDQLRLHLGVYAVALPAGLLLFIGKLLPLELAPWFVVILPVEHLSQELFRLLVAARRPLRATLVLMMRTGTWAIVAASVLWASPPPHSLRVVFALWAAGAAISIGLGVYWLRDLPWGSARQHRFDRRRLGQGLAVALPFLLSSLAIRGMGVVDRYSLELFHDASAVGVYAFFAGIANAVQAVLEAGVIPVLYPGLVEAGAGGAGPEFRLRLRRFAYALVAASTLMILAAAMLVTPCLRFARSPLYAAGLPCFWLMLGTVMITAIGWIPHYALYARHRDRAIILSSVVGFVVMAALELVLVRPFGVTGAAAGVLGGAVASMLFKVPPFVAELVLKTSQEAP